VIESQKQLEAERDGMAQREREAKLKVQSRWTSFIQLSL
jgi:hypothetical protein